MGLPKRVGWNYAPKLRSAKIRPNCPQQLFFGNGLARATGEAHQHLHHLRLQANGSAVRRNAIQSGINPPDADLELVIHILSNRERKT